MLASVNTGQKIREARRREVLTQQELAGRAGVGQTTLARLESGALDNPRVMTLRKIAKALNMDPRDLVGD